MLQKRVFNDFKLILIFPRKQEFSLGRNVYETSLERKLRHRY